MFRLSVFVLALMSAGCVSLDPRISARLRPFRRRCRVRTAKATAVVSQWQQVMNDARLKA